MAQYEEYHLKILIYHVLQIFLYKLIALQV